MTNIFLKIFTLLKAHKILGVFLMAFLIIGLIGVLARAKTLFTPLEKKFATIKVVKEDLVQTISSSGEVDAENKATLQFQTSGKLAWVGVKKGDWVKKWQVVAQLDKYELERKLKKYLRDYSSERWDFEESKDTYEGSIITDTIKRILEKNQFDLDKAVADVEIAHQAAKLATLVSPIAGVVIEIESPTAGVNITAATAEIFIVDPTIMKFVANVDELDVGKIQPGQKAIITLDAYENQTFIGQVDKIAFASIATRGGGTAFPVEIMLGDNTEQRFKKGMNGDVEIIVAQKNEVLTIPFKAIKTKTGKTYVQIIENNKIKEVEIKLGMESDSKVEVIEGLEENQKVIVDAS